MNLFPAGNKKALTSFVAVIVLLMLSFHWFTSCVMKKPHGEESSVTNHSLKHWSWELNFSAGILSSSTTKRFVCGGRKGLECAAVQSVGSTTPGCSIQPFATLQTKIWMPRLPAQASQQAPTGCHRLSQPAYGHPATTWGERWLSLPAFACPFKPAAESPQNSPTCFR